MIKKYISAQFLNTSLLKITLKSLPNLIGQLNIYLDREGLLRVRSKFDRIVEGKLCSFPLLLAKDSILTKLIVLQYHVQLSHAGCYSVLSEIRKTMWIPHIFSVVKKVIRSCVTCRRFNERTVKLNQSPYREFRTNPPEIPYAYIFMDYLGPYYVKLNNVKVKVWLLCITCMWSRGVNLKVCLDQGVPEFLRALQIHCFEFGIPQYCVSDLGSQLVAGANIIANFLNEVDTQLYFSECGVKAISFDQYFKGCSKLGGMVESCVKLTKRLINGSIRNNILTFRDFEFIIYHTTHLVNRRPVAFKEALRDLPDNSLPKPITPEMLTRGYPLVSLNLIPELQGVPESDPDWQKFAHPVSQILDNYKGLKEVRNRLIERYHSEFLATLMQQAVNLKNRYKPVCHQSISPATLC